MHDRHMIWARVSSDYDQLELRAPEGHEVVVEVFVHGRPEPIRPNYVETRRDGWIRFQVAPHEAREDGKLAADDCLIHVPQEAVSRVEIRFLRKTDASQTIGFAVGSADDTPADD